MPAPVSRHDGARLGHQGSQTGCVAHLPLKSGARLPRNAEMPSLASAEANTRRERPLLGRDPLVEVARRRDALDLLQRERRLTGKLARPGQGGVEQFVIFDHAVRKPISNASSARIGVADQVHLERLVGAHKARQRWVPPKPGMIPSLNLGLAEQSRARGDPHVA